MAPMRSGNPGVSAPQRADDAHSRLLALTTGSMRRRYSGGEVAEIVRRMVPVATQLDSDGQLEAYLYGVKFAKLPDVTVDGVDEWIDEYIHLHGRHGGIDYDRAPADPATFLIWYPEWITRDMLGPSSDGPSIQK